MRTQRVLTATLWVAGGQRVATARALVNNRCGWAESGRLDHLRLFSVIHKRVIRRS